MEALATVAAARVRSDEELQRDAVNAVRRRWSSEQALLAADAGIDLQDALYGEEAIDAYVASGSGHLVVSPKSMLGYRLHGQARNTLLGIATHILGHIRSTASRQLGTQVRSAVLGRPVQFRSSMGDAGGVQAVEILTDAAHAAGFEEVEFLEEPAAAAMGYHRGEHDQRRTLVVDIGGGTTDLAIFERGSLWHTGVIGIGGDHFTNDIAVGLRTPIPDAEKLKRKCGCALSSLVDEDETMEVASVGGRKPRLMARRMLSEILQPRAEEIFHQVWDEIRRAGYEKSLNSGIVLTGGGAILEGMPEIAEQIFDLPVRRGLPMGVGGLADHVSNPEFATAVGLILYAQRNHVNEAGRMVGAGTFGRVAFRLRGLFKEFF
jgi:molecular chaperone DnaK (HSP70)